MRERRGPDARRSSCARAGQADAGARHRARSQRRRPLRDGPDPDRPAAARLASGRGSSSGRASASRRRPTCRGASARAAAATSPARGRRGCAPRSRPPDRSRPRAISRPPRRSSRFGPGRRSRAGSLALSSNSAIRSLLAGRRSSASHGACRVLHHRPHLAVDLHRDRYALVGDERRVGLRERCVDDRARRFPDAPRAPRRCAARTARASARAGRRPRAASPRRCLLGCRDELHQRADRRVEVQPLDVAAHRVGGAVQGALELAATAARSATTQRAAVLVDDGAPHPLQEALRSRRSPACPTGGPGRAAPRNISYSRSVSAP